MSSIIADRLKQIKPSPTLSLSQKASELKAQGLDIISLTVGEPDFDTPDNIKEAGKRAIDNGETKYTPVAGTPALRNAICHKFKTENNIEYKPEQVIATTGGKQALYNAIMATVNQGDEVIIPAPYWVSYPDMVKLAEGTPVPIETTEENGFKLEPAALEAAITPKTKWIIFNSPSNPTGATYSADELRALAAVLMRHPHVHIMSDDIYEHLLYDGMTFQNLINVEPALYERTLIVNGLAKGYAMTGWRLGFAAGDIEIIKAIAKIQGQSTSNPCSITQAAAVEALTGTKDFMAPRLASFAERRELLHGKLNEIEGLSCYKSEGAFYLYPSCKGLLGKVTPQGKTIESDTDFADFLLNHHNVVIVPGIAFGLSPFFRISYAASTEVLIEACARIKKAAEELKQHTS
ncbi:MAG: pyridoxal phosphate-dependent aminotransferase [Alphaproteobacteria bacterium]